MKVRATTRYRSAKVSCKSPDRHFTCRRCIVKSAFDGEILDLSPMQRMSCDHCRSLAERTQPGADPLRPPIGAAVDGVGLAPGDPGPGWGWRRAGWGWGGARYVVAPGFYGC